MPAQTLPERHSETVWRFFAIAAHQVHYYGSEKGLVKTCAADSRPQRIAEKEFFRNLLPSLQSLPEGEK